jgi:ABC-type oligopeptide transport system ATPase subunit
VVDLKKYFYVKRGFRKQEILKAVDGIRFRLDQQEAMGIVGESGCGKTTLGKTILRLYLPTRGDFFMDKPANFPGGDEGSEAMQIIFQDLFFSLNPRMKIGKH